MYRYPSQSASVPKFDASTRFFEEASGVQTGSMKFTTAGSDIIRATVVNQHHYHGGGGGCAAQRCEGHSPVTEREKRLQEQLKEMSDSLESLKRDKEECEKKMAEKEERIARERKELEDKVARHEEACREREEALKSRADNLNYRERRLRQQEEELERWVVECPQSRVTTALVDVFGPSGARGIEHIVEEFDFSQFSCVLEARRDEKCKSLVVELAPLYGSLSQRQLDTLDDKIKIGICATLGLLSKEQQNRHQLQWDYLSSRLHQAAHLNMDGNPSVSSEEMRLAKGAVLNPALLRMWLKSLFEKGNIHEATSKMLKASNHSLETIHEDELSRRTDLPSGDSSRDSRLIDITFLRFPSAASPTFGLCRITLRTQRWQSSKSLIGFSTKTRIMNGLIAEYTVNTFLLRDTAFENMPPEVKRDAIQYVKDLVK